MRNCSFIIHKFNDNVLKALLSFKQELNQQSSRLVKIKLYLKALVRNHKHLRNLLLGLWISQILVNKVYRLCFKYPKWVVQSLQSSDYNATFRRVFLVTFDISVDADVRAGHDCDEETFWVSGQIKNLAQACDETPEGEGKSLRHLYILF